MDLKPYQQTLYDKIQASGFKHGELMLVTAGRRSGKSMLNQMYGSMIATRLKFEITDSAMVDDHQWYTIKCNKDIAAWIREQPCKNSEWYQHIGHNWTWYAEMFDVPEELYMMLILKFGK
jgi:hypothetical protein